MGWREFFDRSLSFFSLRACSLQQRESCPEMKKGVVGLSSQLEMFPEIEVGEALLVHSPINRTEVIIDIDEIGHLLPDL